jgi:itaconate CoA-transferase
LFCDKVLGAPQLALDARFASNAERNRNRQALGTIVQERLAQFSASDLIAMLDAATIANASVNTVHGLREHAQLRARDRWTEVASPAGPLSLLRPPPLNDSYEPAMSAIPALGEHTGSVLAWLGYSAPEIDALRAARLI